MHVHPNKHPTVCAHVLPRTHKPMSEGRGESITDTQRRPKSGIIKVEERRKEEREGEGKEEWEEEEGVDPVMLKYMELVRQRREQQVCVCVCVRDLCSCVCVCSLVPRPSSMLSVLHNTESNLRWGWLGSATETSVLVCGS